MAAQQELPEQQFILRCTDTALADKLRRWLREEEKIEDHVALEFQAADPYHGTLTVEGVIYPVSVQNLPALVESYKTLDDTNLIKTADIGQVLVVGAANCPEDVLNEEEATDGVTPFMRAARSRQFRPRFTLAPPQVAAAQQAVLDIARDRVPEGWTFHDVMEEYVVDANGQGRWQAMTKAAKPKGGGRKQRDVQDDSD